MSDGKDSNAKAPIADPVKIMFAAMDGGQRIVETPWAIPLGSDRYELDNILFLVRGISCGDVLSAVPGVDGRLEVRQLVSKSGNRTLRMTLHARSDQSRESADILKALLDLGCDYEGRGYLRFAVNVPPNVEIAAVKSILEAKCATWEQADPE